MHLSKKYFFKTCVNYLSNNYFVTTPIYYVNASPHIGHLYSSLLADTAVRWRMLNKQNNLKFKFATGTDEHGIKVQQAALNHNKPLEKYCEDISSEYKHLANTFNVNYTDFVRTTEKRHGTAVAHFWRTIKQNGYVYSAKYSGWYCVSDEAFLVESQLREARDANGEPVKVSEESGHPVEWTEEENYMFRLSKLSDDVRRWIQKDGSVRPKKFQKILLDMMADGLPDVSISRPVNRVHWGIKVPDDDTQTVYVWLDALVNYLTAAGYPEKSFREFWPPDIHVIGKDILKFHGIYWPAFLMAADLDPPRSLFCHSHWTVDGEKMSKSKHNVVSPMEKSALYTADGFRYFLLREGVAHSDGNYSETKVLRYLNAELADTLGNLLSRCCGSALNPDQVFPPCDAETFRRIASSLECCERLIGSVEQLPALAATHYEDLNFYKVVDATMATLHLANLFFETSKPWILKKSPETIRDLNAVLHVTLETLRVCSIILGPIIPTLGRNILDKINVADDRRTWKSLKELSWNDANFKETLLSDKSAVLFRRIQVEKSVTNRSSKDNTSRRNATKDTKSEACKNKGRVKREQEKC